GSIFAPSMMTCIDPAVSAQITRLMQKLQPGFPYSAPGEDAGGCKTVSNADHAAGMLQGFEAVPMGTLLFKRPDDPFHHAVLLWAMRRDELLAQAVAANQRRVAATRKNEAIVRPKQERLGDTAQRAEAGDQGVFQGAACGCGLAAAR